MQNLSILRQVKQVEITPAKPEDTPEVVDGKGFATLALVRGLKSLENIVAPLCSPDSGLFAAGTTYPTMADMCVVPQLYNCRRFGVDMSGCPAL